MSDTGFKCPECGQTDRFTAYEMEISGPIQVSENGYEPEYGRGLNYEIPMTCLMVCNKCGHKAHTIDFSRACTDEWWPEDAEKDLLEARKNAYRRHGCHGVPTAHVYD